MDANGSTAWTPLDIATLSIEGAVGLALVTTMLIVVIKIRAMTAGMGHRIRVRDVLPDLAGDMWGEAWRQVRRFGRRLVRAQPG